MKSIEKILLGIEGVIYLIIFGIIIYNVCNFKYVKIANWQGLVQYVGIGILLPIVGFTAACILLKKSRRTAGRIIGILLVPYLVVTCFCGFILMLGGITCSATKDLDHYKQYDKEVVKQLERYMDILPKKDEEGMILTGYNYKYTRTLSDKFTISVSTQYQEMKYMERKIKQLNEEYGVTILQEAEKENIYQYGNWLVTCDMEQKQIIYRMEY